MIDWSIRAASLGQEKFLVTWIVKAANEARTPLLSAAILQVTGGNMEVTHRTLARMVDMTNWVDWMNTQPFALVPLAEDQFVLGTIGANTERPGRGVLSLFGINTEAVNSFEIELTDAFNANATTVQPMVQVVGSSEAEPKVRGGLSGLGFGSRAWFFWDAYAYQGPNETTTREHSEALLILRNQIPPVMNVLGPAAQILPVEMDRFAKPVVARSMCCEESSVGMTFFSSNEIFWKSFRPAVP